jgi:hypothetical protein
MDILKPNRWFDYFARKRESNPNAEQGDNCGNNAQHPSAAKNARHQVYYKRSAEWQCPG